MKQFLIGYLMLFLTIPIGAFLTSKFQMNGAMGSILFLLFGFWMIYTSDAVKENKGRKRK